MSFDETTDGTDTTPPAGVRELIVIARADAGLRALGTEVSSSTGADVAVLSQVLQDAGASIVPLFGESEEQVRAMGAVDGGERGPIDLSLFYRVRADDTRLDGIARIFAGQSAVETAYVKPAAALPAMMGNQKRRPDAAPAVTPDFTTRQGYLFPAPGGVDAMHAWTLPGGGGSGVRVVDVEGSWLFRHEDLGENHGGVIAGREWRSDYARNHGTAVAGIIGGDANGMGVAGISPDAVVSGASIEPNGSAWAIRAAADQLRPGDIMLLELHRPGPMSTDPNLPVGYIAIEWWPDDFAAIRYATSRGVVVVECAGNGSQDLDDPVYDLNPAAPLGPFPAWWSNPFRRAALDSGAVLVGAGAPPQGVHGRDLYGPDRSRLDYSNYGAAVDAQGWGWEVTTTGWYGDLQGGGRETRWYTDNFGGTSGAAPMVVGSLACVQGALAAAGRPLLTPSEARGLLRATGSPQQDGIFGPAAQRIGSRPDVRQMLSLVLPSEGREIIQIPSTFTVGEPAEVR